MSVPSSRLAAPSGQLRTRDPLACAGETKRDESVSGMVDLRAETPSLSDKTEFTETKDQSATHHGSTLGTDPSGMAAQREGLK